MTIVTQDEKPKRLKQGAVICDQCGSLMKAGSTISTVTYYYCTSDACTHSLKRTRPGFTTNVND